MKKLTLFAVFFILLTAIPVEARETVTIFYQNDLHGWLFPSSTQSGMGKVSQILNKRFQEEPSSFYAMSGDLFTGPNFPEKEKSVFELSIWNQFAKQLSQAGYAGRVVISAGNHEFDYGLQPPEAFVSGLLCANLLGKDDKPHYPAYHILETEEGLKIGFLGLLLDKERYVSKVDRRGGLRMIPMLAAANRFIPEMGTLDLTILMVHHHISDILELIDALPPELGVDLVLSGHDHLILEEPIIRNSIYVLQAGAMNKVLGRADLFVDNGMILNLKNKIIHLKPTPLEHAMMRVKEKVDELNGKTVAILKQSLLGSQMRDSENSLGNFVADAFRWGTGTDIAMTNSSSLRMDCVVYPGEVFELKEGHFRTITPFRNHLVVGQVSGAQVLKILEGEAIEFQNQVSGLKYKMDRRRPKGNRILEAEIGGIPVSLNRIYSLTHNSFCTRPERVKKFLHLEPNAVEWKATNLIDNEVMTNYARSLKEIDYPNAEERRIVVLP